METKDLRLGNYVNIFGVTHSVLEIKSGKCISINYNGDIGIIDFSIANVNPIPITIEWLSCLNLNLRYETEDYTMHQFHDTEFDRIYDFAKLENKFSITFEGNLIAFIKYIHQLQNFHFLLTKVQLILRW